MGELDLEVVYATFMGSCSIDRVAVISRLQEHSLLITVPRFFEEMSLARFMPSEILNSKFL